MSTREDLEADARLELETEREYYEHEEFHVERRRRGECWLCDRDADEDREEAREERR